MGDCGLQRTQYEYTRKLYEPAFGCDAELHGMYRYLILWRRARLELVFLQVANELHDSARISGLHARLHKMANKVDDMHEDIKNTSNKVDDMQEDIKHTAKDIRKILLELKRSGTMLVSDTLLRQEMPLKPDIFHGRDELVEEIAQLLLQQEKSHICILGPGGMGKTSVALAVVELPVIEEQFPGGNVIWVPCIEATSATLLLEILYIQLQVSGDKQVTLEKIISELDASKQPRIILLDNFETPWNAPGGHQKVANILRKLAKLSHIAIIVTMRGRHPPYDTIKWQLKDIKSTDEAACLRIYHDINPGSENDPDVARLLATLGYMPFAVKLMAKLGAEGQSTAKNLLEAWLKSGPDIFNSDDPEQSMNHSISLSVESRLIKRNPNAINLLAILSLLPAGTTKENLHWWAPALETSMIPSAIATLSQAGLLVENKRENSTSPVLFVVPVVQSFMQQHDRIAKEVRRQIHLSCCEYVLAHACRFDDPTFPQKSKALAAEDTNIQSILFSSPPSQDAVLSERAMEAFIAFGWHRCDTKPNLEIANHAVAAAKATGVVRYIASALWCLGKTYIQLGSHDCSYDHLQEAYRLFNTLPLNEGESQRLGGQCGIDLIDSARMVLSDYDQIVPLAQDVETKCAALSDDVIHGRCLVFLGAVHRYQQPDEALHCLDQAQTMLKGVGDTYNLAEAHQIISWVHYDQGRLPEALDAAEEAWKLAELTNSSFIQALISHDLGKILFSTNRDTKAWEYIEIALIKASYIGDQLTTASVLEYMGYGYLRRGDYQNAHGAYEAAAEKYLGTASSYCRERCEDNMARIKQKQENPAMVVGFYGHSTDMNEDIFYPQAVQAAASNVPISGS